MNTQKSTNDRKPICVVVDTRVWRSEPLLKSPLGVTLIYTLSRQGGFVGLPEVIESELKRKIVEAGVEASEKVKGPLFTIRTLTEDVFLPKLPTEEDLMKKVDERLAQLSQILVREPFTFEQAKAALEMVDTKVAPNRHKQQFKDSVIWQAVLSLSRRYETRLVAKDKEFFGEKKFAVELAPNLRQDCSKAGVTVEIHRDIASCLKAITEDEPTFDKTDLIRHVIESVLPSLLTQAKSQRFVVGRMLDATLRAFRTADPNRIAVDYTLIFLIEVDETINERSRREDCRGVLHGSCDYFPQRSIIEEHLVQQIALRFKGGSVLRSYPDYDAWARFPRPIELERDE